MSIEDLHCDYSPQNQQKQVQYSAYTTTHVKKGVFLVLRQKENNKQPPFAVSKKTQNLSEKKHTPMALPSERPESLRQVILWLEGSFPDL